MSEEPSNPKKTKTREVKIGGTYIRVPVVLKGFVPREDMKFGEEVHLGDQTMVIKGRDDKFDVMFMDDSDDEDEDVVGLYLTKSELASAVAGLSEMDESSTRD